MAYQQVLTTNNLENVTPGPKSQEFWQARKDALGFISANTVVSDNNTTTTLVWQSHDDYINFLRNNIDLFIDASDEREKQYIQNNSTITKIGRAHV